MKIAANLRLQSPQSRRHERGWRGFRLLNPTWYGVINLAIALGVVIWLFLDARFEASVDWWSFQDGTYSDTNRIVDMGDWWWLAVRNKTALSIATVVVFSSGLVFWGFWRGPRAGRSIRAWLIATSIFALWLSVTLNWQNISWLGKQFRLRAVISEFDHVVEELNADWPTRDDARPSVGQFMAYPSHKPATLILLTLPEFKNTDTTFSVVEGGDKTIRLELVGAERGDWLEWHPTGSTPKNFTSGLEEAYTLTRSQKLSENWFLARYSN